MSFKKTMLFAAALLLALLLVGCGGAAQPAEAQETPPPEQNVPEEEPPREFQLGSLTLTPDTRSVDLHETGASIEELMSVSDRLENVKEISLGVTGATLAQLRAVETAFPQAVVSWKAELLGEEIDCRADSLDLRAAARDINAVIHGRGGGRPEMITGRAAASRNEIASGLKSTNCIDKYR